LSIEPLVNDPDLVNDDDDVIPEHVIQKDSDEPQLIRSIRPHQPFTIYSPQEYVLITNGGGGRILWWSYVMWKEK